MYKQMTESIQSINKRANWTNKSIGQPDTNKNPVCNDTDTVINTDSSTKMAVEFIKSVINKFFVLQFNDREQYN